MKNFVLAFIVLVFGAQSAVAISPHSVTLSNNAVSNATCQGNLVTFTATAQNFTPNASLVFKWYINNSIDSTTTTTLVSTTNLSHFYYAASSATNYTISVVVDSTATLTDTVNTIPVNITVNPNPTATAGSALSAICQGGTTGTLGGSFGGGATAAVWSDGGAGGSFSGNTGSAPGSATYTASPSSTSPVTLTLTTSGGSCGVATATKTQTVNPNPTATAGSALSAICQGGTTGTLGGSFGGGATAAVWSDGGAGGSFSGNTGSAPGSATYTASPSSTSPVTLTLTTSGGSCGVATATKTQTVNPNPTVTAGSALAAICRGATTVALGGLFGGGATAAVWSDGVAGGSFSGNTGSTPASATYTASSTSASSVTLTLTTSGGSCGTVTANKSVTVKPLPAVSNVSVTVCSGVLDTINVSSSLSNTLYSWTTSLTSGNSSAYSITSGGSGTNKAYIISTLNNSGTANDIITYTVYDTANGCGATSPFTITETLKPSPTVTIAPYDTVVCQGSASTALIISNPEASPIEVFYNFNGSSQTISSINANTSYTLPPQSTATPGIYPYRIDSILYTSGSGGACANTSPNKHDTITVRPTPTANITGDTTVCAGAPGSTVPVVFHNPEALAINAFYHYNSGAANSAPVSPNSANNLTTQSIATAGIFHIVMDSVNYTSAPHCAVPLSQFITVTVNPNPTASFGIDSTLHCQHPNDFVLTDASTVASTNGSTLSTYHFYFGDGSNTLDNVGAHADSVHHSYNSVGTYPITDTVTSDKGCQASATGSVTVYANPTVAITDPTQHHLRADTLCDNASLTLTAHGAGGTGGLSYAWSSGTIGDTTSLTAIASGSPAASSYTVTVTDAEHCTGTGSQSVVFFPNPATPLVSGLATVCSGAQGITFTTQGQTSVSYLWTSDHSGMTIAGNTLSAAGFGFPTVSASTPVTLTVAVTNQPYGCTVKGSETVTVIPGPDISGITVTLDHGTALSCSEAGLSYQWGYDVKATGQQHTIDSAATYQTYIATTLDTTDYYYWVMISDSNCSSRIYLAGNGPNQTNTSVQTIGGQVVRIAAYPNPVTSVFYLTIEAAGSQDWAIEVYAIDGTRIMQDRRRLDRPSVIEIGATQWAAGTYALHVISPTGQRAVLMLVKE